MALTRDESNGWQSVQSVQQRNSPGKPFSSCPPLNGGDMNLPGGSLSPFVERISRSVTAGKSNADLTEKSNVIACQIPLVQGVRMATLSRARIRPMPPSSPNRTTGAYPKYCICQIGTFCSLVRYYQNSAVRRTSAPTLSGTDAPKSTIFDWFSNGDRIHGIQAVTPISKSFPSGASL